MYVDVAVDLFVSVVLADTESTIGPTLVADSLASVVLPAGSKNKRLCLSNAACVSLKCRLCFTSLAVGHNLKIHPPPPSAPLLPLLLQR